MLSDRLLPGNVPTFGLRNKTVLPVSERGLFIFNQLEFNQRPDRQECPFSAIPKFNVPARFTYRISDVQGLCFSSVRVARPSVRLLMRCTIVAPSAAF